MTTAGQLQAPGRQGRTRGGQEEDTGLASAARGQQQAPGGQEEDKRRVQKRRLGPKNKKQSPCFSPSFLPINSVCVPIDSFALAGDHSQNVAKSRADVESEPTLLQWQGQCFQHRPGRRDDILFLLSGSEPERRCAWVRLQETFVPTWSASEAPI